VRLLLGSAFRYGAVELAGFIQLVQQRPYPVYRRVRAGNGLLHFLKRSLYLGTNRSRVLLLRHRFTSSGFASHGEGQAFP